MLSEQQEKRLPMQRENSPIVTREPNAASDAATLEFGRFQVLLRRRELLADGTTVELGTRAFDLLLALLEADGSLVPKGELMRRVWPGIVVAEENLKVQIFALRRALGKDRDFIRTEFGRGYRFIATIRSAGPWSSCQRCRNDDNRRVNSRLLSGPLSDRHADGAAYDQAGPNRRPCRRNGRSRPGRAAGRAMA
jgi:DNA-binding winged helix-turn-helix (wHTH) protein